MSVSVYPWIARDAFKPLQLPAASDNQQQGGGGEEEIGNDGRKGDVTALLLVDEVEEEVQ